jgi:hypothetical protein
VGISRAFEILGHFLSKGGLVHYVHVWSWPTFPSDVPWPKKHWRWTGLPRMTITYIYHQMLLDNINIYI